MAKSPQPLPAGKIPEIESLIRAEMSRQSIPGLSIAIAAGDAVPWSNGYGMADLEDFVPAKRSTVYRLASRSKPITAVAILQLVEKGRIDLDVPIQTYLPELPVKPWPITVRQLLGHLDGVRHYKDDTEAFDTCYFSNLADAIRTFQDDPLVAEPGTKYSYTTYGFVVLGGIVERASGTRYIDYLREHLFLPAGMVTIRPDDVYTLIPNRARGYSRPADGTIYNAALSDPSIKIPAGDLASSAEDLVNFAMSIQRGKLLNAGAVKAMFTAQHTRDGKPTYYPKSGSWLHPKSDRLLARKQL